jgi:hypothetical protein
VVLRPEDIPSHSDIKVRNVVQVVGRKLHEGWGATEPGSELRVFPYGERPIAAVKVREQELGLDPELAEILRTLETLYTVARWPVRADDGREKSPAGLVFRPTLTFSKPGP